jgi:phosphoribosylamine--glycine ligase
VVIEEFMNGIEVSVFVLTDGNDYVLLPEAKDYKRIGVGDTGPNTGGMGSVSPVPFFTEELRQKIEAQIIRPTLKGLKAEQIAYSGFIFFGLMIVAGEPRVIEYNVRLGDPETESVLPRIKGDLLEMFRALGSGKLANYCMEYTQEHVATVMLVSEGYPGSYERGLEISLPKAEPGSMVFHAGTREDNGLLTTNGGRVLAVTSVGAALTNALSKSYRMAETIHFQGRYFRHDIGHDVL